MKPAGKDQHFRMFAPLDLPWASPSGNLLEQPCQPSENAVHPPFLLGLTQADCLIKTQTDRQTTFCDRHKHKHRGTVTKSDCLGKTQTVSDRHILSYFFSYRQQLSVIDIYSVWQKKDCMWQTHIVCDRYRLTLTDTNSLWQTQRFCERHMLYVTDKNFLCYTKIFCDSKPLSVTDICCLWQKNTICDRNRFSVTDTYCLWQTHTVCDQHRLPVTDTDCLWRTHTVDGLILPILFQHSCVYSKGIVLKWINIDWNWFSHFYRQFIGKQLQSRITKYI